MYSCERCHYSSAQKGHLLRHLSKKHECKPLFSTSSRHIC